MKNGSLIINIVLIVAVVVLFILHFTCSVSGDKSAEVSNDESIISESSIVYVNTDSLLLKYEFAKYLNEELLKKEERSRTDFNEQANSFKQDALEFQRKYQNNGFLSLERAKQEEQRLAAREQELQELNARLSNQLMVEQNKVNLQLRDTLVSFLKEIQPSRKFQIVLSNTLGDNVLYSQKGIDITNDVVTALNSRYSVSKK